MAYWSVALLLVSVSFLAYRHPSASLEALPRWLWPDRRRELEAAGNEQPPNATSHSALNGAVMGPELKVDNEEPFGMDSAPKANGTEVDAAIPTFSLHEVGNPDETKPTSLRSRQGAPSSPVAQISPSTLAMPPPPKPIAPSARRSGGSLISPPPRPTSVPPPSSASSLRLPTTGPLPNRGLPANSQQRVGGGLTVNGTVSTPNLRGKVLLAPGHSPMDWAALTRKGNLSGVATFQRVTPSTLKSMTGRKGKPAWSSWQGKVYNITPYLPFHPGGEAEIMKAAGRDGTKQFMEVHPWVNWENMLGSCLVGVMVPENYGNDETGSSLEDMD